MPLYDPLLNDLLPEDVKRKQKDFFATSLYIDDLLKSATSGPNTARTLARTDEEIQSTIIDALEKQGVDLSTTEGADLAKQHFARAKKQQQAYSNAANIGTLEGKDITLEGELPRIVGSPATMVLDPSDRKIKERENSLRAYEEVKTEELRKLVDEGNISKEQAQEFIYSSKALPQELQKELEDRIRYRAEGPLRQDENSTVGQFIHNINLPSRALSAASGGVLETIRKGGTASEAFFNAGESAKGAWNSPAESSLYDLDYQLKQLAGQYKTNAQHKALDEADRLGLDSASPEYAAKAKELYAQIYSEDTKNELLKYAMENPNAARLVHEIFIDPFVLLSKPLKGLYEVLGKGLQKTEKVIPKLRGALDAFRYAPESRRFKDARYGELMRISVDQARAATDTFANNALELIDKMRSVKDRQALHTALELPGKPEDIVKTLPPELQEGYLAGRELAELHKSKRAEGFAQRIDPETNEVLKPLLLDEEKRGYVPRRKLQSGEITQADEITDFTPDSYQADELTTQFEAGSSKARTRGNKEAFVQDPVEQWEAELKQFLPRLQAVEEMKLLQQNFGDVTGLPEYLANNIKQAKGTLRSANKDLKEVSHAIDSRNLGDEAAYQAAEAAKNFPKIQEKAKDAELAVDFAKHSVAEMQDFKLLKEQQTGEKWVEIQPHEAGWLRVTKKPGDIADKITLVPEPIRDRLVSLEKTFKDGGKGKNLYQATMDDFLHKVVFPVQKIQRRFLAQTVPGTIARNALGTFGLGYSTHGAKFLDPALQKNAVLGAGIAAVGGAIEGGKGKTIKIALKNGTETNLNEVLQIMQKDGILNLSKHRLGLGAQSFGPLRAIEKGMDVALTPLSKTNQLIDDYQHISTYLGFLDDLSPLGRARAADLTAKWAGNYARISAADKTLKEGFNFYSWLRFIVPRTVIGIAERPKEYADFAKYREFLTRDKGDVYPGSDRGYAEYLKGRGITWEKLPVPGSHEFAMLVAEDPLNMGLALVPTLKRMFTGQIKGLQDETMADQLAPLVRYGFELLSGADLRTGGPVQGAVKHLSKTIYEGGAGRPIDAYSNMIALFNSVGDKGSARYWKMRSKMHNDFQMLDNGLLKAGGREDLKWDIPWWGQTNINDWYKTVINTKHQALELEKQLQKEYIH